MECDFSEFSYGYAAIREAEAELSQMYRATGAPVLPSLLQEELLGWDAQIQFVEYVLFLQFKRAEFVSRRHPASPTWPHVGTPHYRFSIDTDGHQHAALLELEESLTAESAPGNVYYAAPRFHRQREFDVAYSRGAVLDDSSLVCPSDFGEADGRHHFVSDLTNRSLILSEPREARTSVSWDSLSAGVRDRALTGRASPGDRSTLTVGRLEEMVRSSERRLRRDIPVDSDAPPVRRLQRSAAVLGCGLILFVSRDEGS